MRGYEQVLFGYRYKNKENKSNNIYIAYILKNERKITVYI
jgi:hypothetical protein